MQNSSSHFCRWLSESICRCNSLSVLFIVVLLHFGSMDISNRCSYHTSCVTLVKAEPSGTPVFNFFFAASSAKCGENKCCRTGKPNSAKRWCDCVGKQSISQKPLFTNFLYFPKERWRSWLGRPQGGWIYSASRYMQVCAKHVITG